jgi:hypothetical protein
MSSVAHSLIFLLGLILSVAIPFWLIGFVSRSLSSWMASRADAKVLAMPADAPRARLDPESRFVVQMTEFDVSCHRPDGIVERVRWDDLQRINILTNGDGPFAPDCFWLLIGLGSTGCCIPHGATGDTELLARMQQLPGFNNQIFMEAMGSTQEAIFTCWEKAA